MNTNVLALLLAVCFISCNNSSTDSINSSDTNRTRLKKTDESVNSEINKILRKTDLSQSIFNNEERIIALEAEVAKGGVQPMMIFNLAKENLNAGKTEKAIEIILSLKGQLPSLATVNEQSYMIHQFEAICYLRLAEQKNCHDDHNGHSCIVPLRENGLHKMMDPSKLAVAKYSELLKFNPNDYESKWLLNVAHMTLGQYPHMVPKEHLIPLAKNSKDDIFENIATDLMIDGFDLSGGIIMDDFNNDGYLDLMTSSWSRNGKMIYYENDKRSGFVDKTKESGLASTVGGLNLKQADFNNDGFVDFIILRGGWFPLSSWGILPNSLIKNNGDGTFTDVSIESKLFSVNPTQSAEWLDYNNDGWIDLFVANETTKTGDKAYYCELFKNSNGVFENVASTLNTDLVGYFKGVNSSDINNDGYPDVFISNLDGPNVLLQNNNGLRFTNIAGQAGVESPNAAFPCMFFDHDNDGFEDLYIASYDKLAFNDQSGQFAKSQLKKGIETEENILYRNVNGQKFENFGKAFFGETSLSTMGCNYGDIENDGYKDIYLGTGSPDYRSIVPNRFFSNSNGSFNEQTFELGLGHIQKGHGIAFGDMDNDGDQDIYAVMGGAFTGDKFPNAFFQNPGTENNWVKLKLIGSRSNKSAIGAKIRLAFQDGSTIYHTVNSGASFGANPLMAHIGIGQNENITKIEIKWPNGDNIWTTVKGVKVNQCYKVHEQDNRIEELELDKISFKKMVNDHSMHHH